MLCDGLVVMVLGQGMDEEMTSSHSRFGLSVSMAWFKPLAKSCAGLRQADEAIAVAVAYK